EELLRYFLKGSKVFLSLPPVRKIEINTAPALHSRNDHNNLSYILEQVESMVWRKFGIKMEMTTFAFYAYVGRGTPTTLLNVASITWKIIFVGLLTMTLMMILNDALNLFCTSQLLLCRLLSVFC
uniref:Uncharacterized protein n=1 Tax=Glossina palpalis gambiensis TaxID=67801 RepID=A0A1B0C1K0_9MUSC